MQQAEGNKTSFTRTNQKIGIKDWRLEGEPSYTCANGWCIWSSIIGIGIGGNGGVLLHRKSEDDFSSLCLK